MAGGRKLYLWQHLPKNKEMFAKEREAIGPEGTLENVERIHMGVHSNASFDEVKSGVLSPQTVLHNDDILATIVKLAKPGGKIEIGQAVRDSKNADASSSPLPTKDQLLKQLKLAGFVKVQEPQAIQTNFSEEIREALKIQGDFEVVTVSCSVPDFEFGSSRLLSFAKKKPTEEPAKTISEKAKVWSIADVEDDDVDLVDQDDLLDADDLVKPDPASLRVCGTTGKRKACKDCSCGLKEELEAGKKPQKKDVTSSCGSCYLGDAFRCASCPYLGMPAFKPGEKIQLSTRQLKADS